MANSYLLDTNAYFNFLKYASSLFDDLNNTDFSETITKIKSGTCYISTLSSIEIVSTIGKYARRDEMKKKQIHQLLKLVKDTMSGSSPVLAVSVLPFSEETISEARNIIKHALIHNFGSLDSLIAATAKEYSTKNKTENLILITSDKGLKACLKKCDIPYWDAFNIK